MGQIIFTTTPSHCHGGGGQCCMIMCAAHLITPISLLRIWETWMMTEASTIQHSWIPCVSQPLTAALQARCRGRVCRHVDDLSHDTVSRVTRLSSVWCFIDVTPAVSSCCTRVILANIWLSMVIYLSVCIINAMLIFPATRLQELVHTRSDNQCHLQTSHNSSKSQIVPKSNKNISNHNTTVSNVKTNSNKN